MTREELEKLLHLRREINTIFGLLHDEVQKFNYDIEKILQEKQKEKGPKTCKNQSRY